MILLKKIPKISVVLFSISFICLLVSSNINWGKENWKGIIESDAKGYYAYLPATFIYNDFNFNFFDKIEKEKYYNKNWFYEYRITIDGKVVNKYYCGTAVAQLPFFLIAHFITYITNYDLDGYSKYYPILINIAAIFYLLLGLYFLHLILNFYNITTNQKIFILIATVFGTNLFYYTIGEPGMSHIYSFAFITMFVYYAKKYFITLNAKNLPIIALFFGIIIIIRPINGLIIFIIPFLATSKSLLLQGIKYLFKNKVYLYSSVVLFMAVVFIQLLYYKLSTGNFIVYSYGDEGFNFLNPNIFNFLFSYRKGLFVYTPLFLISLTGLYYLFIKSKFEFFSITLFLIFIVYVLSSWWMWYYGGSFSTRVFVEYIALFMILLAIALNQIKRKFYRIMFITTITVLILLCQVQTYLYRYYIIHWSDMTKEMYWNSYLELGKLIK